METNGWKGIENLDEHSFGYYCKFSRKLLYRVIIKLPEAGSQKLEENSTLEICNEQYK